MLWVETARVRLLVLLLLLVLPLPALSALPSVDAMLAERSLGSPTAKVTIIEYSSLTCPHCADFHRETLPQIREQYIDKGLVRYVVRDFPLEGRAMAAAMVAACVPPNHYFGFVDMLFRDQADVGEKPEAAGRPQGPGPARRPRRRRLRCLPRQQGAAGGHPGPRRRGAEARRHRIRPRPSSSTAASWRAHCRSPSSRRRSTRRWPRPSRVTATRLSAGEPGRATRRRRADEAQRHVVAVHQAQAVRLQVLRRSDRTADRARAQRHRRAERLRQIQPASRRCAG